LRESPRKRGCPSGCIAGAAHQNPQSRVHDRGEKSNSWSRAEVMKTGEATRSTRFARRSSVRAATFATTVNIYPCGRLSASVGYEPTSLRYCGCLALVEGGCEARKWYTSFSLGVTKMPMEDRLTRAVHCALNASGSGGLPLARAASSTRIRIRLELI
jgi:hypothetical protein